MFVEFPLSLPRNAVYLWKQFRANQKFPGGARMRIGVGFLIVLGCIFGGFVIFGGNIGIVLRALPHEMMTIAGGAIGAFVVANSGLVFKKAVAGLKEAIKGETWQREDYQDLLSLLFIVSREMRAR